MQMYHTVVKLLSYWYSMHDHGGHTVGHLTLIARYALYIPIHVGLLLQLPLAKQDTAGDPDRMYPLVHVYTAML